MLRSNRIYDELKIGDSAAGERGVTANDLVIFAHASGNLNPLHMPGPDGTGEPSPETLAPSMWVGSLFSALFGNDLPGFGTLYLSQSLRFHTRVHAGDLLQFQVVLTEKRAERVCVFACRMQNQRGELVCDGTAEVIAPASRISVDLHALPRLTLGRHRHFNRLLDGCKGLAPLPTAVVCPEDEASLGGAILAAEQGLIIPILVGSGERIRKVAADLGESVDRFEIVEQGDPHHAAARSVAMVHEGRAGAIMKGFLHSDELLTHVTKSDGGLRTSRRISHVFVMDVPGADDLLIVTDAAINIAPDLTTKVDIVQNAIDLARAIGMERPRVGILSAVETVNPKIPSTLDAAILAKMAERGQIKGGLVDGPLAMDNAVDVEAARTKGITSLVAGRAQVLVAPNIEAGNMMAKELTFVAHAEAAGLVLGARVPVMLTSRADDEKSRLVSCALALLLQEWKRTGRSPVLPLVAAA